MEDDGSEELHTPLTRSLPALSASSDAKEPTALAMTRARRVAQAVE